MESIEAAIKLIDTESSKKHDCRLKKLFLLEDNLNLMRGLLEMCDNEDIKPMYHLVGTCEMGSKSDLEIVVDER